MLTSSSIGKGFVRLQPHLVCIKWTTFVTYYRTSPNQELMAGKRKTRSASKASRSLDSCHETPLGQKESKAGRKAKDEKIGTVLYALPNLVRGTLRKRPSAHIKSPYVADVDIHTQSGDVEVLAHCPCLDMGGLCAVGSEVFMSVNNNAISLPSALTGKHEESTEKSEKRAGEPKQTKTSVSIQLVRSREPESNGDCLIGAHPSLGNKIAMNFLQTLPDVLLDNLKDPNFNKIVNIKKEFTVSTSGGEKMRADFVLDIEGTKKDGVKSESQIVVEVKNVVCADYAAETAPSRKGCVYISSDKQYERCAIFPWGNVRQMFQGEKCVSERACSHVKTLGLIAAGKGNDVSAQSKTVLLLIVNRGDAVKSRACYEACPVWAREVKLAISKGMIVLAIGINWTEKGIAQYSGVLPFDVCV